jgi:hypothetical protein
MLNHPIKSGDIEVTFDVETIIKKEERNSGKIIFSTEDQEVLRWYFSQEAGIQSSSFKQFLITYYGFNQIFKRMGIIWL